MGGVLEPLNMDNSKTENRAAGRLSGKQQRIDLPDEGEQLWPLYTDSKDSVLNPKSLQRIRRQLPAITIAGVLYVNNKAARQILAEPQRRDQR
jgi:hypothetical protein